MAASAAQQAAIAISKKRETAAKKTKPGAKKCGKKFPGDYDGNGRINAADFKKYRKDCKRKGK